MLRVLGSQTRVDILTHLSHRQRTVTSLSKIMGKSKSTLHEHLKRLEEAGLVEKHQGASIWVYYGLSREGRELIEGKPVVVRLCQYLALFVATLVLSLSVLRVVMRSYKAIYATPPLWLWLWFVSFLAVSIYFLAVFLYHVRMSRTRRSAIHMESTA